MSNNELQHKSFANIISKKDFEKLDIKEQKQFFIKNNIYIISRDIKLKKPKRGHRRIKDFDINPLLANEIIELFFKKLEVDYSTLIKLNKIKTRLTYLEGTDEQFKSLQEEIKKYTRKVHTNDLSIDFKSLYDVPLNIWDEDFQEYFIDNMILEEFLIEDYITNFKKMNFQKYYLFNKLIRLFRNREILEFLKKYEFENFTHQDNNNHISPSNLTLNQSLILLDEIITNYWNKWADLETTKKSRILSKLLNRNYENVRKKLPLLVKKPSETSKQHQKDIELISNLLDNTLS